ncbi:hypothetical protein TNCT_118571, partial [Trichonephila clavata]
IDLGYNGLSEVVFISTLMAPSSNSAN